MSIESLREELHQRKVNFDRQLAGQKLLDRAQRLAQWEKFLVEVRPLAVQLDLAELRAIDYMPKKIKAIQHYPKVAQL